LRRFGYIEACVFGDYTPTWLLFMSVIVAFIGVVCALYGAYRKAERDAACAETEEALASAKAELKKLKAAQQQAAPSPSLMAGCFPAVFFLGLLIALSQTGPGQAVAGVSRSALIAAIRPVAEQVIGMR
jgi:hypothetical protein